MFLAGGLRSARVKDCPEESVESKREVILTSGALRDEPDEEADVMDDESASEEVESGMTELLDDLELDEPEVALEEEMLIVEIDMRVAEGFLGEDEKYSSIALGTLMSRVLIASNTSQGS